MWYYFLVLFLANLLLLTRMSLLLANLLLLTGMPFVRQGSRNWPFDAAGKAACKLHDSGSEAVSITGHATLKQSVMQ